MPENILSEEQRNTGNVDLADDGARAELSGSDTVDLNGKADLSQSKRTQNAKSKGNQDLDLIFGEIVAVLMRSPLYRHCSLSDLEWLVIPPLLTRQFQMIRGQKKTSNNGQEATTVPIGVALWAHVSLEIDEKLEEQKKAGLSIARIAPLEWCSGDIPWLLAVSAPEETKALVIEKLGKTVFGRKNLKLFFSNP